MQRRILLHRQCDAGLACDSLYFDLNQHEVALGHALRHRNVDLIIIVRDKDDVHIWITPIRKSAAYVN